MKMNNRKLWEAIKAFLLGYRVIVIRKTTSCLMKKNRRRTYKLKFNRIKMKLKLKMCNMKKKKNKNTMMERP